ncbi:hypothetical protein [Ornithobacterium rhinotracheale]|uniref:hypothetical protein n=1 Tax=Ornithobacterium rhinotracheale TaxID=28251 RepID=UPI0002DE1F18|nr:hypothetical protein [Ornithobacterium rhinotracheale]AIQ00542.1 hypothetical protein Q785_06560 [Ornithobacterium rhinotracheale ORT-UMN 88]KGB66651.1 hypothetical protein Q787_06375 [Ornithobacterium rhinotracheale H06-030791]MCK0194934.1 hypothetical protein [Ornithobacterium rhinotracheale]MCK0199686.1 hypothetical protein [Ornithobacterium rhinotracheale]MCK0203127.1 hypothetical protein [Ornithobacterium rhinotracheale]
MSCHLVFANLNGILISNVKLKLSFGDNSHFYQKKQAYRKPPLLVYNILGGQKLKIPFFNDFSLD